MPIAMKEVISTASVPAKQEISWLAITDFVRSHPENPFVVDYQWFKDKFNTGDDLHFEYIIRHEHPGTLSYTIEFINAPDNHSYQSLRFTRSK